MSARRTGRIRMEINILLVAAAAAAIIKMIDGYKKGMIKEIISLVSMVILCVVAALLANGVSSYHDGKIFNVIVMGAPNTIPKSLSTKCTTGSFESIFAEKKTSPRR